MSKFQENEHTPGIVYNHNNKWEKALNCSWHTIDKSENMRMYTYVRNYHFEIRTFMPNRLVVWGVLVSVEILVNCQILNGVCAR